MSTCSSLRFILGFANENLELSHFCSLHVPFPPVTQFAKEKCAFQRQSAKNKMQSMSNNNSDPTSSNAPAPPAKSASSPSSPADPWDFVITVDHVNWLLKSCGIVQENSLQSLSECSSSLFVLLFQRLLNFGIPNLELEPNTVEKKLWNTTQVLHQLQDYLGLDLSHISAEEIVHGNQQHISMLIRVFLHLAVHLLQIQQEQNEAASKGDKGVGAARSGGEDNGTHDDGPIRSAPTPSSGGQAKPHDVNGADRITDDDSSRDSAQFTNMLVSSWKDEIIPPARRKLGAALNPKVLSSLQRRMHHVDLALLPTSRRHRPCVHDTREKVTVLSPRELHGVVNGRQLTDGAARDSKIETLRALRFVDELQQQVRAQIHQRDSLLENQLRDELREKLKKDRRDFRDLKQLAKDEDEKLRLAYASIISSARPTSVSDQRLYRDDTRKIAEKFMKKEREARRVARETARDNFDSLQSRLKSLVKDVQRWQDGLFR